MIGHRNRMIAFVALLLTAAMTAAAEPPAPAFVKPPGTVRASDGSTRIEFALDRGTDVAVYVLNAKGEVVRHLAAGMLGANAPPPLKAGSPEQSIPWDGKDDAGKPAAGGPFKVRVAAGLAPRHDGFPLEKPGEPYLMNGVVLGIGVAPDGGVFTITHRSLIRQKGYFSIQRYARDGRYAGTLMPFSSQIDPAAARGVTPVTDQSGRPLMVYGSTNFALLDYMPANPLVQTAAVRKNGNLLLLSLDGFSWERGAVIGLTELLPDGGTPGTPYVRLAFKTPEHLWRDSAPAVVLSEDEKSACVVGLQQYKSLRDTPTLAALYRVALDGDGTLEPVFGEPAVPGGDEKHLADPAGLAADGKGHLLIADRGNNRVVVLNEKDASWAGSFDVDGPLWVGAHRKTGAIYVYCHRPAGGAAEQPLDELVRFSAWPGSKAEHRLALSSKYYKGGRYVAGMDASCDTPRIWLGQFFNTEAMKSPTPQLLGFCDDLGDRFSDVTPVPGRPGGVLWWAVSSDPSHRYVVVDRGGTMVIDDATGDISRPARARGTSQMGPDGLIYVMGSAGNIRRYTMKGQEVPFKAVPPGAWMMKRDENGRPFAYRELAEGESRIVGGVSTQTCEWPVTGQGLPTVPSGTSGNERDFTLDRDGNIYVKNRGRQYHGPMTVDVYDKDGAYLRTAVWEIGDRAYGPRLDAAGNLYFAMGVCGENGNAPEVFRSIRAYQRLFAGIVKFSPRGGALHWLSDADYAKNFGFQRPATGLPTETVHVVTGRGIQAGKLLEGALWWRPGFSVYNVSECHCNGHSFDVDPFGRVFYPDMLRFQIGVLDANGNQILRFGSYGNRDQRGPSSWLRDPASGALRPPGPADAKGPASPFAQPEFAFAFLNGVAVTDRHLYATDTLNQRLTRIRLDYAAEATCDVPG